MAIFDFLRNKGKKLFGASRSQAGSGSPSSGGDSRQQQDCGKTGQQQPGGTSRGSGAASTPQGSAESKRQADAIREHILSQDDVDAPESLVVLFGSRARRSRKTKSFASASGSPRGRRRAPPRLPRRDPQGRFAAFRASPASSRMCRPVLARSTM